MCVSPDMYSTIVANCFWQRRLYLFERTRAVSRPGGRVTQYCRCCQRRCARPRNAALRRRPREGVDALGTAGTYMIFINHPTTIRFTQTNTPRSKSSPRYPPSPPPASSPPPTSRRSCSTTPSSRTRCSSRFSRTTTARYLPRCWMSCPRWRRGYRRWT